MVSCITSCIMLRHTFGLVADLRLEQHHAHGMGYRAHVNAMCAGNMPFRDPFDRPQTL